jgi:hypothetical protein
MEKVSASRDSQNLFAFLEAVHADYAFCVLKLIICIKILHGFKSIDELSDILFLLHSQLLLNLGAMNFFKMLLL